jgi:hypothetical protein
LVFQWGMAGGIIFVFFVKNNMQKNKIIYLLLCALTIFVSACSVVTGIFKAGMAWGIILVFLVIGLVIYLISRGGKNK